MSLDLSRKNRATRRKVHARRARLQLESLEQRRLMAVVAEANGPYNIVEGEALVLDASGTSFLGSEAQYSWDLDNDGSYDYSTNLESDTLTWAQLEALNPGLTDKIDGLKSSAFGYTRLIGLRVTPLDGPDMGDEATDTADLSILNVAPDTLTADLDSATTGPFVAFGGSDIISTRFGDELTLNFSATDLSTIDMEAGLSFTVNWGDGSPLSSIPAAAFQTNGSATHTYAAEGTYNVILTVKDKDGGSRSISSKISSGRVYVNEMSELVVEGTSDNDNIVVTANNIGGIGVRMNNRTYPTFSPLSLLILGNEGNDSISIASKNITDITIYGGAGDDYIAGGNNGNGLDPIYGGAGNDRIISYAGSDVIFGDGENFPGDPNAATNTGNDNISGGANSDAIYGGPGNDTINGEDGDDTIYGGAGNDTLYGGNGADWLFDTAGVNTLDGGAGNDLLSGGSGVDTMYGRAGDDVLIGNDGADKLYGGNDADLVLGNIVGDTDAANMWALWISGNDIDTITTDYIDNGAVTEDGDADLLYGELGADWFVAYLADAIKDFKLGDAKTVNGIRLA